MKGTFLLLVFSTAAWASSVESVFKEITRLHQLQENQDARQIAELDRRSRAMAPQALKEGWKSVAPLSEIMMDRSRPEKIRLLAASFLGLGGDPLALPALHAILSDPAQSPALRASAAGSISGLGLSKTARRRALCPVLVEENLDEEILTAVLMSVETIGCEDPLILEKLLRRLKFSFLGEKNGNARRTLAALGSSPPPSAALSAWRLFRELPAGWPLRKELESILLRRSDDLSLQRISDPFSGSR